MNMFSDQTKMGIIFTIIGPFMILMSTMLFFDRVLLTLGNFSLLIGLILICGFDNTRRFVLKKEKIMGIICFFIGVLLLLLKWTLIGMIVELFGLINLFGNLFPIAIMLLRRMPVIGSILKYPLIIYDFFIDNDILLPI